MEQVRLQALNILTKLVKAVCNCVLASPVSNLLALGGLFLQPRVVIGVDYLIRPKSKFVHGLHG